jgi:transcriptional regulator with XRE-family HTH domain
VPDPHAQTAQKIVQLLHAARKQRGMSQETLAVEAGVSPSCIQHLEHARSTPTLITLLKLAEALDVDLADLLRAAQPRRKA